MMKTLLLYGSLVASGGLVGCGRDTSSPVPVTPIDAPDPRPGDPTTQLPAEFSYADIGHLGVLFVPNNEAGSGYHTAISIPTTTGTFSVTSLDSLPVFQSVQAYTAANQPGAVQLYAPDAQGAIFGSTLFPTPVFREVVAVYTIRAAEAEGLSPLEYSNRLRADEQTGKHFRALFADGNRGVRFDDRFPMYAGRGTVTAQNGALSYSPFFALPLKHDDGNGGWNTQLLLAVPDAPTGSLSPLSYQSMEKIDQRLVDDYVTIIAKGF